MSVVLAIIGPKAIYLLFTWLASAVCCAELAKRKGYRETNGLGSGLILSVLAIPIWLLIPAREGSDWKLRRQRRASAQAKAEAESAAKETTPPDRGAA